MSSLLRLLLAVLAGASILGARWFDHNLSATHPTKLEAVNPVVGDASYVARFHHVPTTKTSDFVRIQTHLAYAEQRLRRVTPASLPLALRQRRAHLLDLLHAYWQAGVFPQNAAPDGQRHPCFIDGDGRICAVGYLVEQTAGRSVAERINRRFQYSNLLDMRDAALTNWVASSGLSREECALIQPTYGPSPVITGNNIPVGYGATSAVLGGLNLSAIALNSSDAGHQAGRWLPLLTMASGTAQIVVGATRFPEAAQAGYYGLPTSNDSQKLLSMANIGVGTATLLFGTWNLLRHRDANASSQLPRTSWNVGPAPSGYGQRPAGMSVYVARRL